MEFSPKAIIPENIPSDNMPDFQNLCLQYPLTFVMSLSRE